ncbi:methylenetetrahydrofolate reductase (NADPH) [Sanguibacter gelidistatuariae]|uniref:Methylenetetrahydrofolate reductase n=1 Tax=Sanguibacter gelidistatuariae TaxID=1814289 RepID=A0A1G6H3D1_9MICO|nr:methylenetetrahydrofolate reductase [Sanguibacter gelidistatuariae]SDB87936.1 methylenetetrahydrofolate reductase (NADPH) [Sanguibacter gelidistatuariae]
MTASDVPPSAPATAHAAPELNAAHIRPPTRQRPTISFELMPPRNPAAAPKFWGTVERLIAARPDFVSVTYGAAGGDRDTARTVISRILEHAPVLPIAHLTCVGASRDNVAEVIDEFLAEGVRSFLALRGDPPRDQPDWRPHPDGVHSSDELVALLREVEATRCASNPSTALRSAARPLTIAVATFPDGNLAAGTTRTQEVQRLLEKQQAGANFAITQLFYEASTYIDFVTEARAAGVTIPILAGLLPMTDPSRLARVESLTGVPAPSALVRELEALDDPAARHALGIRASVELANAVLAAGAPGLHIYTFNKHEAALDLLEGVHLGGEPVHPGFSGTGSDLASGPWVGASPIPAVLT